jgi:hypothetical protein
MNTTPEQRVVRGCGFVVILTAILAAINVSANGLADWPARIFLGIFVVSTVCFIVFRFFAPKA